MPLEAPTLDDRRFDDIVAEAFQLIPRFAPEWTDRNDSDPGVALTKLFAWMSELTLFRLNQVPELNYIRFLQMVGIDRIPASAAQAIVTFAASRTDVSEIFVPQGTQLAAPPDDNGQIIFETTEAVSVLGTALAALQVWDGFSYSIATSAAAADGQSFHAFGPRAREGAALMLGFAGPASMTAGPISLYVRMAERRGAPPPVSRADPAAEASLPPPARLVWEYWDLANWQPMTVLRDETSAMTRSGHVRLRGPGNTARLAIRGDVATPLYWLRCRVETTAWEATPRVDAIIPSSVPAIQATTQRDEVVGRSDGTPGQGFTLALAPVLPLPSADTLMASDGRAVTLHAVHLEVDEGSGFEPWQEVEDFHASGKDDPHFTLNRATATIRFGDGVKGRIPAVFMPAGGRGNIVARRYLSGGGLRGNLPAGAIATIQGFLPGIASVTNPFAATGGAQEETVGAAKKRAAAHISANGRAVTATDFETNALEAGVRRAKALALTHPRYPGVSIPGSVTVIVVPDGDEPNPMPSDHTLASVALQLDQTRLITTEVHVVAPTYNEVSIEADIVVKRTAAPELVRADLEARLNRFLHPLTGGSEGLGWPFGGDIYYSDIYRLVIETRDVVRLRDGQLGLRVNGELAPFCRDVTICPGELVFARTHRLAFYPDGSVP
ncbi:putative baseplate assembly protein [Alteraurantiacibacter aquimixticola]|uniref:Putative baseplate assembly protein n=1 Tax=Alteraurantiacibacter aquimixticola TaxID=2489173 RepID=A0A4T3EY99_9SPHN|nr:putative baseplate assembly protein [Alteraurantiacibacter aquimixticola]TIX49628.1 putative baseplate assembly protein [Alteraurantiacibacter aquimixticola]